MSGGALGSAASDPAPAGPMTGQPGFAAGEMEPNGGKHRFLRSENRNKVEEVPRPICHGSGKHRFSRSENRDEIEEVKQNAMSLV